MQAFFIAKFQFKFHPSALKKEIQISQIPDYEDSEENESVCNSQASSSKPEKESILPPPNPILNHKYGSEGIKTALKVVFRPLPEFQLTNEGEKLGSRHQKFRAKMTQVYKEDESLNQNGAETENEEYQVEDIDDGSLYSYYFNLKAPQVYKKFDNSNCNSIPYSKKKYFASYFCNIRNIIADQTGKTLMEQNLLMKNTNSNSNNNNNNTQKSNPDFQADDINEDQSQQEQLKTSTTEQSTPKNQQQQKHPLQNLQSQKSIPKLGELKFDSNFESGNLFAAFKISEREYDLVLQNDINSKGNTQWFFFSVQNMAKNQLVKFNIVNFLKNDSLFNYGMKPVVFSQIDNDERGTSWSREGFSISYEKGSILREGSSCKYYYKLSFSYKFKHANDTVYLAQCYPYTYSDLSKFTTSLLNDPQRKCFISKKLLCYSIAKNKCEIYTITSSSYFVGENDQKENENSSSLQDVLSPLKRPHQLRDKKKIVFLTARQHPGETPASYMIQGVMEFLTDPSNEQAAFLREHFIFKIVPMLNPDGVIHGNYRCSLSGVDLNRQWSNPSRDLHPTIYFTKNAILKYCTERQCRFLCDFHGHSKKMNSFFYGNPYEEDPYLPRIIPMECQNLNKGVDFRSCTFKLTADKQSTFRQALLDEMPHIPFIYTFEASFYGSQIQYHKNHFSIDDFKNLGRDVIKGFYRSVKQEVEEEIYLYSLQEQKSKSLLLLNECEKKDNNNTNSAQDYKFLLQTLIDNQGVPNDADNGSDSNPSEDELSKKELNSLNKSSSKKLTKKLSGQQNLSKNETLRLPSRDQNKRQIKTALEEKNSFAFSIAETTSTKVSSQKKIVLLYKDQEAQTESNFDFSKLQRFSNQREFFNQISNSSVYTQYTQEQQQDYEIKDMYSSENFLKTESNQFSNKLINQALFNSNSNDKNFGLNLQRPKTSNISGDRYNGTRNASVSIRPKDQNSMELKSNLLNSNYNINDTQIFQKRGASFHSTSTGFHSSGIKSQLNSSPFKITSYNTPIQQHQLLINIQTQFQNKAPNNRLFISGIKYSRDHSRSKTNPNDSSFNMTFPANGRAKRNQEVQTQISIPIIQSLQLSQNSINQQQLKQQKQQQLQEQQQQQQQIQQTQNILNDIQNQQQNYNKISPSPIQQNQNQSFIHTYNKNHLNGFSPKKKQYILCIQKKDPNSKSPQLKQPIEKRILNSTMQQNNLFKNMNMKIGREIIHSPMIKLFKNINQNNNNASLNMNIKQSSDKKVADQFNQSLNTSVLDRNKSFDANPNNTILQTLNSSSVQKDHRSNSLNLTGSPAKGRQQPPSKQNMLNYNSILFTEQASVDYIRQCSPYQSPIKKGRSIGTAPSMKYRQGQKPLSTEPTDQSYYNY